MQHAEPKVVRLLFWPVLVLSGIGLFFSLQWLLGFFTKIPMDLEVYRLGVQAWWQGQDVYGELPATSNNTVLPFIYPPFSLLILSPFALLSEGGASVLMFVLSFIALLVTIYVITRRVWRRGGPRGAMMVTAAVTPIAILLEPVSQTFYLGQVSIILMAVVVVDCLAPKTWWPRGLGVGLVGAIKLTPLAFLLFFLFRKDFRAAIVAVGTAVAATIIGFVVSFHGSIHYWLHEITSAEGVSGSAFRTNQTIEAVLARTGLPDSVTTPLWVATILGLVVLTAFAIRRSDPPVALMANAALSLLVSPTSWSHYWVWAVPAIIVMATYVVRRWRQRALSVAGWVFATLITFAVCYLAPFQYLPFSEWPIVERDWTVREQLLASAYVLMAIGLLVAYGLAVLRRQQQFAVHPEIPVKATTESTIESPFLAAKTP